MIHLMVMVYMELDIIIYKDGGVKMELDKRVEELEKKLTQMILTIQLLEDRISKLENGEHNTGIYVDGCSELVRNYLSESSKEKKEGE